MKISDFRGLLKKSELTIIDIENPYGDYYEIKLKAEPGVIWKPGEHGVFKLIDREVKGKKRRAFSLASIPEEGLMLIATRTGKDISSFKRELISMKKGEKLSVRGPFGWFKVQDEVSPIVMIAGGIGITPIRSLLKQLEEDTTRPIEVIYSSSDFYLYGDEIQQMALRNDKIIFQKTHSREETRKALEKLVNEYKDSAYYYISGSQKFITSIKKEIKSKRVKGGRIINDPFLGY